MIKAVLFDIDGTLVDSNDLHVDAWMRVFAEAGRQASEPAVHAQIGKGGDNLLPSLFPGITAEEQQALTEAHGRLFKAELIERVEPFPQATALLRRVHDDGRCVVLATSAGREELDHYVALLDIGDIVSATTSKDDVDTSKPAPDIFAAALQKADISPDEAVVVGDTPYDVAAAAKAGMGTVALLSGGFGRADLADADTIYTDVAALLADYDASPLNR